MSDAKHPKSVDDVLTALGENDYLADEGLATAVFLSLELRRPLFLEGEVGVGKTEVAKVLSRWLGGPLIRLQCYEGIDSAQAVYEWDYARQLLHLRTSEATGQASVSNAAALESELYDPRFLIRRPLLEALSPTDGPPPVLLIDEVDRADDEFEALLFEFLAESSVTVPELGTFTAKVRPVVVLTSNRSRELHDALKRRCFYHWIEYPTVDRSAQIVRRNVPGGASTLVDAATNFVARTRSLDLDKPPGLAEAIDWVSALHALGITELDRPSAAATLGAIAKSPDDLDTIRTEFAEGAA